MQKLGYLISKTRVREVPDFIEVTDNVECYKQNKPALIVGLDMAKKNIGNFSIIKKEASLGKFWTFGKTERRIDYDRDVKHFYDFVLSRAVNDIKYYYVDITKLKLAKIKGLLKIFVSEDAKYGYISKRMLYLYHKDYVLGISLNMLEYSGINTEKWLKKISSNKSIRLFYTDKNINVHMKQYAKNRKYIMPFFLSLTV